MGEPADRPAFYALASGGWRDYWSLLHPPYTLWHLSYVVIGACIAPVVNFGWLFETALAFFLAMGLAAHALDELNGRPLRTRIPDGVLSAIAVVGLAGAFALGIHGAIVVSPWLWVFIAVGGFLVVAYNLELLGGAFHSDLWFALGWGVMGAISGFLFALTLALAERGRTIATLSMGRVALWGGVGALVLPLIAFLVFLGIFGSHGMYIEFIPILSVVGLGTACSTTILWLGRRGSESPAGSRPAA